MHEEIIVSKLIDKLNSANVSPKKKFAKREASTQVKNYSCLIIMKCDDPPLVSTSLQTDDIETSNKEIQVLEIFIISNSIFRLQIPLIHIFLDQVLRLQIKILTNI